MSYTDKEMYEAMLEQGLLERIYVDEEESKKYNKMKNNKETLPDGIYSEFVRYNNEEKIYKFYRLEKKEYDINEYNNLLLFKQEKHLRTIKFILIFFLIVWIISSLLAIAGFASHRPF